MKRTNALSRIAPLALALLFLPGSSARACSACFGAPGSDVAGNMSIAILFMLVLLLGVLSAFVCFFFYLKKQAQAPTPPYLEAMAVSYHEGAD
jgi:hypothetical protein